MKVVNAIDANENTYNINIYNISIPYHYVGGVHHTYIFSETSHGYRLTYSPNLSQLTDGILLQLNPNSLYRKSSWSTT